MRIRGCEVVDIIDTQTVKGYVLVDWKPEDKGKSSTSYFKILHLKVKYSWGIPLIEVKSLCEFEKRKEGMECFSSAEEAVDAAKAMLKRMYWLPRKLSVDQSVPDYYSSS